MMFFLANLSIIEITSVNNLAALTDDINNTTVGESKQEFKDYTFDSFIKYERVFNEVH